MKSCQRGLFFRYYTRIAALCVLLTVGTLFLAACGGSTPTQPSGPVTLNVWTDTGRIPASVITAFEQSHPNIKIKLTAVDRSQFPTKVLLFNRTGSGWPDVYFSDVSQVPELADAAHHFPGNLTPYVSKDILNNFATGSLAACTVNGKLDCLRNDLSQEVFWYNSKLFSQFGYQVPTTWEEYQALGLRLAKEHPGYYIGAFGDGDSTLDSYFWPARCPIRKVVGNNTVLINTSDSHCTRVANMLDALLPTGVIYKGSLFDNTLIKAGSSDHILMLETADWFGNFVMQPLYKAPSGEWADALPLQWSGDSQAWDGAYGGAGWMMSSHTQYPQAAATFVTWMSTSATYQGNSTYEASFPAYLPVADTWGKSIASNSFFFTNPYPIMKEAANLVDPNWGPVSYDTGTAFQDTVVAGVLKGQTVASTLASYQSQLVQLAKIAGYTVKTS